MVCFGFLLHLYSAELRYRARVLESVHTGFCIQFMYAYLIKGFGNYIYFLIVNEYVLIQLGLSMS